MNSGMKLAVVLALAVLVVGVIILKERGQGTAGAPNVSAQQVEPAPEQQAPPDSRTELPRLVDLGATECIPCRAMAPILDQLQEEYAGRLVVEFIDVWENPDAKEEYGVRLIPTQVFYDPAGQEVFRHEGFFGREDILDKCQELGFDLTGQTSPAAGQ